jgi:nicotinate-nucleotide adenylyltransferase
MRRISIFGGAFDPITLAHIEVANFVLENTNTDEIWIMPVKNHKYAKKMAHFIHRLMMCKIAVNNKNIKVSGLEIQNKNGSTYSLLKNLSKNKQFKDCNFTFTIGLDNALTFYKWFNYKWLEKNVTFIVIPRPGFDVEINEDVWFNKPPHINLVGVSNHISSTEVRKILQSKRIDESLLKLIDTNVLSYIIENHLYMD